jgi:hypothetical protein
MKLFLSRITFASALISIITQSFQPSLAKAESEAREEHKFGIYGSLLGDPYLSLTGINLAYNLTSFMRLTAGYGQASVTGITLDALTTPTTITVTSIGGGLKLFLPHSSFSPVAGFNYSSATVSISGTPDGTSSFYGLSAAASIMYANFGIDWQTHYGLDIGLGYNLPITAGLLGIPYFNLGWFF